MPVILSIWALSLSVTSHVAQTHFSECGVCSKLCA